MSIGTITNRSASLCDILDFYGQLPLRSVRAWVMEIDGDVKGIAGYGIDGDALSVFSDVKPGVPKMTIWRQAKKFMGSIPSPAYCRCTETSAPFLERLGWTRLSGDVFKYVKD